MRKLAGAGGRHSLPTVCLVLINFKGFSLQLMGWRGEPGGRSSPWRSCGGIDLANWERMEGDPEAPSIEKGFGPRREKGKGGLLPGVRSRGAEEKGMFMGADLGITSGRMGSSPE